MKKSVAVFALLLVSTESRPATSGDVAVIVNAKNDTRDVSFRDLERIFRQEKQYWGDGKKIYLVMQETGSLEKEVVLAKVFHMDEATLKRFWLSKMFRGEIASFPKTLSSAGSVKQFVEKVPNAIGFVDASLADPDVELLKIDGRLPGAAGYPLSTAAK